jgi:hypothetical protein
MALAASAGAGRLVELVALGGILPTVLRGPLP